MHLPDTLQNHLLKLAEHYPPSALKKGFESLAKNYRLHKTYETELERIAYLFVRMPATFATLFAVLQQVPPQKIFLDLGAGPGTSLWVIEHLFPHFDKVFLYEKDEDMLQIGKKLSNKRGSWVCQNVENLESFPQHDLALFSYSLGEFSSSSVLERVWKQARWGCVIVEPGTPYGFEKILEARTLLLQLGGKIFAPCPHENACPHKWCHFPARVERSFYHKYAKSGALSYEDEKYSYVIVSKENVSKRKLPLLAEPQKFSGHLTLKLCTTEGIQDITLSRRHKERYKKARKLRWGDALEDINSF